MNHAGPVATSIKLPSIVSFVRPHIQTWHPSIANLIEVVLPIPLPPPVITATLSLSIKFIRLFSLICLIFELPTSCYQVNLWRVFGESATLDLAFLKIIFIIREGKAISYCAFMYVNEAIRY